MGEPKELFKRKSTTNPENLVMVAMLGSIFMGKRGRMKRMNRKQTPMHAYTKRVKAKKQSFTTRVTW